MNNISENLEEYLIQLDLPYKKADVNMWIIDDLEQDLEDIIINIHDNVITIRVNVCKIPSINKLSLYKNLLLLNEKLIYGGYSKIDDNIVLIHSIPITDELSFEKFSYIYHSFTFSLIQDLIKISNIIK